MEIEKLERASEMSSCYYCYWLLPRGGEYCSSLRSRFCHIFSVFALSISSAEACIFFAETPD